MKKLVVGWLVWLTQENLDRRRQMVEASARSLSLLKGDSYEVFAINNGGLEVLPLELPQSIRVINTGKNFIDLSAMYFPYLIARDLNRPYFCFLYDDFEVYRDSLDDCVQFMEENTEINCMRLPAYKTGDKYYDTRTTPKSVNPDSVNHEFGAGKSPLLRSAPSITGNSTFYHCNWRPNSRPMLWRTESFARFSSLNDLFHPVMQPYEARIYKIADDLAAVGKYHSAYLEGGMCKTFPVNTSERTRVNLSYWDNYGVDMTELLENYVKASEKLRNA